MNWKEFFCLHKYEWYGIDCRKFPYIYVLKCKKCGKRKHLVGKYPTKKKSKDFIYLDNEKTKKYKMGNKNDNRTTD